MILKRNTDIRTVAWIALTFAQLLYLLKIPFADLSLGKYFLLLLWQSFLTFEVALINHNHRHHPIFTTPFMNQLCGIILSFDLGAPSARLHQVHWLNHHRHYQTEEDWTNYQTTTRGGGPLRILTYVFFGSSQIRRMRHVLTRQSSYLDRSLRIERGALLLFVAVALLLNWKIVLALWIPGWIIGLVNLFVTNLLNHDNCELDSKYDHSRDFLNSAENWLFFNNGYHTAHHLKPTAHWSDLPQIHKAHILPFKSPKYVENSYFGYLSRYLKPGFAKDDSRKLLRS